jgi:hypothetical protein
MLFQWVASGFKWDEKEQKRAAILGSFNGVFILKDILDAVVRSALGMKVFDPSVPILSTGRGVANATGKLTDGDITSEDIAEAVEDLLSETVGPVTGAPIKQLYNAYDGILEMQYDPVKGAQKVAGWTDFALEGSKTKTQRISF